MTYMYAVVHELTCHAINPFWQDAVKLGSANLMRRNYVTLLAMF